MINDTIALVFYTADRKSVCFYTFFHWDI